MDSSLTETVIITVLMPVYNCELYIEEAVESILNQTYANFEFLIIDDHSTDKTVELLKNYNDSRIKLIEKPVNTGYTNSLNYGLTIAKGKYIARMDGDDVCLPKRFEKQVAFMEANEDVVVCGTSFLNIGINQLITLPETHEQIKIKLLSSNCIVHPSVMLRKNTLKKNSIIYDKLMEPAEDYDLWVRMTLLGKLHNLQDCLLCYRVHESQVSSVRNYHQKKIAKSIGFKLLLLLDNSITQLQKKIYLKAMENKCFLTFQEFEVLLNLKKQLLLKNKNHFFNTEGFLRHWLTLEINFNGYYFKSRTTYSFTLLLQYVKVYNKLESKLSTIETFKLILKTLIRHKIK